MSESIDQTGPIPITPRERKMYEQEYKHGAQLFQKALEQYAKSDSPFQKHEFEEVMEKAMKILNQTARELSSKSLVEQNNKIQNDYEGFIKNPKDQQGMKLLKKDLDQAQKSV